MEFLFHDVRHAVRSLVKAPRFTLIVVVTLTLAIGATTAVFSIVNGVLLNPLGFADPDRLAYVRAISPSRTVMPVSPQDLIDFRARTHSFTDLAAVDAGRSMTLTRDADPALRISAARVGASFFSILGVNAALGRTFLPHEDAKDAPKVVVLSHAAWAREFGSDPRVIGRRITLDDSSYEVVGIAPAGFVFPDAPDVWFPAQWHDYEVGDIHRGYHSVNAIGRLKPGVTIDAAARDLQDVAAQIARDFPTYDAKVGATALPLRDQIIGDVERPLWMMFGAVSFVLLVACANVANLLLVRAAGRESDLAVRAALGASRRRLLQQLVAESLTLSAAGALLGTIAAAWTVDAVVIFGPAALPRLHDIRLDTRVLAFAAVIMFAVGIGFGLLPGLRLSRPNLPQSLRAGARGLTDGRSRARMSLVVIELALATMLVVGAGLFIRSFANLVSVDPGFKPEHLVVFDVTLAGKKYEYDAGTNQFTDEVQRRLAALPGTKSVAVAANRPIDPTPMFEASTSFTIEGEPKPAPGTEFVARLLPVSPNYFATLGITVARGQTFTEAQNRLDAAPVVVVNQALVDRYFPNQNPIGKHLTFGLSHHFSAAPGDTVRARGEVIGVVANATQTSLSGKPEPSAYFPFHTMPFGPGFVVRTDANPALVQREIRAQIADVDRNVPVFQVATMSEALNATVAEPRFYTLLLGAFAAIALMLAALGIYGTASYTFGRRTREFGIRLALGATPIDVVRLVAGRGMLLAACGITLGILGAVALSRAVASVLFEVGAFDPITFVLAPIVLGAVALLGLWIPARRASGVDPVTAMRSE